MSDRASVARLLVLDLDGTLVDSSADIASALNAALQQLRPGCAPIPLERVLGFVGEGARLLIERALAHARLVLPVDQVLAVYLDRYRERLLDTTRLYAGVEQALATLAADGVGLAVLTNKPGELAREILAGLGVAERFARIKGAGDVSARKPDPAGLRALLDELGVGAPQAWMVGDAVTDVHTARAAGVRVAGAGWGFQPEALRAAAPDRILDEPRELVRLAAA